MKNKNSESIPEIYKRLELQIGFTDFCDMMCKMCMQSAHISGIYGENKILEKPLHHNKKGFMTKSTFNRFLYSMKNTRLHFRFILLHWLGESLLHPELSNFLKQIIELDNEVNFFDDLMLFTNSLTLTEQVAKSINDTMNISKKRLYFVFSIDASTSTTFSSIKGRDRYNTVIKNIKDFIQKYDLPNIKYIFRFLIMPENHEETKSFIDYWSNFCIKEFNKGPLITFNEEKPRNIDAKSFINLRRVAASNQKEMEMLHKNTLVSLGIIKNTDKRIIDFDDILSLDEQIRKPCAAPFRTPIINWDGEITACCADSELELKMGNINFDSFDDIFLGEPYNNLRNMHLFNKKLPPRCTRCGNLMGLGISEQEIKDLTDYYRP